MNIEPIVSDLPYWDTVETREFYTLREVAEILRMDAKTVYKRLINRKVKVSGTVRRMTRLRHFQDGKGTEILVRHRDLVAYVEKMTVDVDQELEGKQP